VSIPHWEKLPPYRAVVAVDARDFSSLDSAGMQRVNESIRGLLAQAMSAIGLSSSWEKHYFGQHTGDGYVAGLDPEYLPALVGCFPEALCALLREHPRPDGKSFQLRVSLHIGPLPDDGLGVPMVETHRLLDDDGLRRLLARATPRRTPLAMIVSDRVYEDVFSSGRATGGVSAEEFTRHLVRVKTFEKPAWVHIPGIDWNLVDRGLLLSGSPSQEDRGQKVSPPEGPQQAPSAGGIVASRGDRNFVGYNQTIHGGGH